MSHYFLPQRCKREFVLFIKVEKDLKHTSLEAIHAPHLNHYIDKHPEVRCSKPHLTSALIERHSKNQLEQATLHVTLNPSTFTLELII